MTLPRRNHPVKLPKKSTLIDAAENKHYNKTMSNIVDHRQRRTQIVTKAFALFAEEGYAGVTYQKVADRCGLSRTALYRYFTNKEEMFLYAVELATNDVNRQVEKILAHRKKTPLEKLVRILHITVRLLAKNQVFLTVILDYILTQKQHGKKVQRQIRRRTFGLKYTFVKLLRDADEVDEVRLCQAETAAHHLYGMLESFILNLTVTNVLDEKDCLGLIDGYIELLKAE